MNSIEKKFLFSYSLIIILLLFTYLSIHIVSCDVEIDEEGHPMIPECKYAYVDGMAVCPNVTSGGAIPKLMQCANKLKHDFMGFCKNPPSDELLDQVREQCLEVCVLPCLPTDMMSVMGECDVDVSSFEPSMDMFCSKKKQKLGKLCAASLFRKHKNQYMDLFNKKIHMICDLCERIYQCYVRVKKEVADAAAARKK